MSGTKVNDYSTSDTNIETLMLTTDQIFKGKCECTLTEMDTTTVPEIAAGSCIEVNGTLFKFDSDESISTTDPVTSTTVANGTVYVLIVPSTDTCTAAFTATAPTWSDSKQGWYGTGDYVNYRYIYRLYKTSDSNYNSKFKIKNIKLTILQVEYDTVMVVGSLGDQSISPSTTTKLSTTPVEIIDTHSAFSSGTFTAQARGVYQLSFINCSTSGGYFSFYKNSSSLYHFSDNRVSGESVSYYANLEYGDMIDIYYSSLFDSTSTVSIPQLEYRLVLPL